MKPKGGARHSDNCPFPLDAADRKDIYGGFKFLRHHLVGAKVKEMVIPYPQCADVYAWRVIWFDESISLTERKDLRRLFPKPSDDFPL